MHKILFYNKFIIRLYRTQLLSLEFFIDIKFLPIALWPWGRLRL